MNLRKLLVLCFGTVLILAGCNNSTNPTAPAAPDARTMQNTPTKPSDDTADSDIVLQPYKSYTIAAVGNSITYGTGSSWGTGGYPGMLEAKLRAAGYNAVVRNHGIPGSTSYEIDSYFDDMVQGADIVLIMIGTNDIVPGYCLGSTCPTVDHIRSMVNKALRSNILPVLGTITPKKFSGGLAWANPSIVNINAGIIALANEYNLKVADNYTAIVQNGGDVLFFDQHHFTDQGYDVLANEWFRVLTGLIFKPV